MRRARLSRLSMGTVAVVVLAVLCTGCAQEQGKQVVDLDRTVAVDSQAAADPGEIPVDPVEGELIRGLNPASAPEPRAVTEAWFAFRSEVNQAYRDAELDRTRLSEVSAGEAYDVVVTAVEGLRERGTRDVGGTIAAVTAVRVHGVYAHVEGCLRTDMVETDADGEALEPPEEFVVTQDTLEKVGGRWRVTAVQAVESPGCEYR